MKRMYTKTHEWINFIDDKTAYMVFPTMRKRNLATWYM